MMEGKTVQACIYNQNLGKFIQPDTIIPNVENPQAFNRYSYVVNNPLLYIDPSGHSYVCDMMPEECGDNANENMGPSMSEETFSNFMTTLEDLPSADTLIKDEGLRNGLTRTDLAHGRIMYAAGIANPDLYLSDESLVDEARLYYLNYPINVYTSEVYPGLTQYPDSDKPNKGIWWRMFFEGFTGGWAMAAAAGSDDDLGAVWDYRGTGKTTYSRINRQIVKGNAPRGVTRIDYQRLGDYETPHIHFENGAALNVDGTWKHGYYDLTNAQVGWLNEIGWNIP